MSCVEFSRAGKTRRTRSARRTSRSWVNRRPWTSSITVPGAASATPAQDSASSYPMRTAWPAGRSTCDPSHASNPEDLADVPIAVGMRAGSHFNVPYRLEPYLPLEHIKTINIGGFGARLQALLDGEVEAASLLDPQISMADQLGLHRVIFNTFKTLWVVPAEANTATLDAYFRVLQRADADLDRDPASCLPLWRYSIPPEFAKRPWDFARFDVGERFFYQRLPRQEFDQLLTEAERWGLADQMQSKELDELVLQPAI